MDFFESIAINTLLKENLTCLFNDRAYTVIRRISKNRKHSELLSFESRTKHYFMPLSIIYNPVLYFANT